MPNLTIKGVPLPLYEQLKARAAEHRRSLNGEIIVCLEQVVGAPAVDPYAMLAKVDRIRERLHVPRLTEEHLREAKSTGRP